MKQFYNKIFLILICLLPICNMAKGQCTFGSSFGSGTINLGGSVVTISTCSFAGEYSTVFGAVAGQTLNFTFSDLGTGAFITIHSGSPAGPIVAAGTSPLSFANGFTGTLYAHWSLNAGCGTDFSCHTSTVQCTSCAGPPVGCTNGSAFGSAVAPVACGVPTTVSTCSFGGEYSPVTSVLAATNYTSTMSAPGYITVHEGAIAGPIIAFGPSPLVWNSTVAGTYFLHWNTNSGCGTDFSCHTTTIQRNSGCVAFDPCASIPNISGCGVNSNVTYTGGAGAYDPVSASCGFSTPSEERIFTFTPAITGNYRIAQTASTNYIDYFFKPVSGGCNNSGWTCIQDLNGFSTSTNVAALTAGVQYYILADMEVVTGSGSFNIVCPVAPPVNDDCTGAINIPIATCGGTASVSGNTTTATADAVATCGTSITAPGIWYSLVGDGSQITANICPNLYDTKINVYSGACASLTCETGNDDFCGLGSQVSWFASAGVTYNILVQGFGGQTGAFTMNLSSADVTAPTALCQSVSVFLDAAGNGSTSAVAVNNGSSDNCGVAGISLNQTAFTCGDVAATTVTLTVTDAASNSSTCIATVNVFDNVAPTAICQDITVQLDGSGFASIVGADVDNFSNDACGIGTLSVSPNSFSCTDVVAPVMVTLTVTDVNANSSTCTSLVTVEDNVLPIITCPANIVQPNIVLNCGRVITYSLPTFSDNCVGTTIAQTDITGFTSGQLFPVGSTIQTFTATDASGNTASCSFTITIQDVELPVITSCPSSITVNNTLGSCDAVVSWVAPTASDNCPGVTLSSNFTPGSTFPVGATTVVYTATDAATPTANTATCTFIVTVMDAEAPVLTCPANTTVDCLADNSPATQGTATATDNCTASGSIIISSADFTTLGSCNGNYSIARTWTATDLSIPSNMSSCVQTITVTDVTGPVLFGVPLDASVDCSSIPAAPSPVALDNCSGVNGAGVVFNETITAGSCAGNYIIHRTWSATDNCGNMTSNTQNITVTDVTAPVLSGVPANTSVDCGSVPAPASPTAIDNCSGASITFAEINTPGICAGNYTLTRTWTATDGCGNASIGTQIITVSDVSAPVLAGVPADASADCASIPSAAIVTATDDCSGLAGAGVTLVETVTAGSCAGNYVLHRTWTAVDNCGNMISATQNITVTDVTSPVLSGVPSNISVDCASVPTPSVVTATDDCSGISGAGVVLTQTITAGSCAGNYVIHRTWSATDNCGNTATSATQDITVTDVTGPLLNGVPANATADCGSVPVAATVTVSDNCSGVTIAGVVLTETTTAGSCAGNYVLHRTWTATDNCGNVSSATQDITVSDVTAPAIAGLPSSSTISCPATPSFTTPTATDDCSGASLTFADVTTPGACAGSYSVSRTWTATDGCGNMSTATETIVVQDLTAPVITTTPVVSPISCPSTPSFTMATAVDACGSSTVTFSDVTTPGACGGSYSVTRTWVASDGCGNTSTAMQTIVVQDLTGPVITCNPNVVVNVGSGCVGTVNLATPSAGDACGGITSISSNHPSNTYPPGVTTVTWTATDACGNTSTCLQTVTVTAPEMDVTGNGQPIADNTLTVSTTNNTDFGSVPICGFQVFKTYIIKNSGSGNLSLTGLPKVTITGSTDFVVTTQPTLSVLSPGQSVTFIVRFDPSVTGFINGTVNINNTDCNENPYNFAIKGTGRVCLAPMEQEEGNDDPIVVDPSGANVSEETNTTEIETIDGFNGRLYPNPSNGIFTLELSEMPRGMAEIRITDALGQVLFSSTIMNQVQYYDFSHFRAATYYLQVITNEGSFTKQIIITHNY